MATVQVNEEKDWCDKWIVEKCSREGCENLMQHGVLNMEVQQQAGWQEWIEKRNNWSLMSNATQCSNNDEPFLDVEQTWWNQRNHWQVAKLNKCHECMHLLQVWKFSDWPCTHVMNTKVLLRVWAQVSVVRQHHACACLCESQHQTDIWHKQQLTAHNHFFRWFGQLRLFGQNWSPNEEWGEAENVVMLICSIFIESWIGCSVRKTQMQSQLPQLPFQCVASCCPLMQVDGKPNGSLWRTFFTGQGANRSVSSF